MAKLEDSIFSVFFNEDAENIEEGFFGKKLFSKKAKEVRIPDDEITLDSMESAKHQMELFQKVALSVVQEAEKFFKGIELSVSRQSLLTKIRGLKPIDYPENSDYLRYSIDIPIVRFTGSNAVKLAKAISDGEDDNLDDIDGDIIYTYLEKYFLPTAKKNKLIEEESTYGLFESKDGLISFNCDEDYEVIHINTKFYVKK